ncbi:septum formation inhibitor Maf [Bacillus sp. VT 712]|uniref:dTTP/UTP pyrophosphatase n=2 Tax=Priestia TaxID=2800373 RepID=A0A0V8JN91_9BACI|nr:MULTISPECIES: Maf family protein [Bacillaceae]AQX53605.1 septum formation inhibitor Maf [Priestia flexa]KSU88507.1 septum formation protein Maf [Priestia veravalensis]KZB92783.1 septum formation inhibitor Maf [Bacillus sp. VT 712]MBN8432612.1 septum formation inhibitor Maf [Priestia flexa]MBY6085286.1 Maf-like protein [Priestia flexa]
MNKELILASGSPRRKELLQQLHIPFSVHVSNVDEKVNHNYSPSEVVMDLALQKASDVATLYPNHIVLGSDTVVVYKDSILGKPASEAEAVKTLEMLSGKKHQVLTGVALVEGEQVQTFYEKTDVEFWPLTVDEITQYVRTGEPMDKAGSYGIQGLGAMFVKSIQGDYFSVVGLPLSRTIRELRKRGFVYSI